jgi:hypothetical protein
MKNIHILPTDKPSRLCYDKDDNLLFAPNAGFSTADGKQNIYITSDEEIKEGYYLDLTHNIVMKSVFYPSSDKNCKKIILTTDQDLIKDGIQPIDDEFLEWFVKNPSCERVEVSNNQYTIFNSEWKNFYKIIIPKEEPKQRLEKYSERFDNKENELVEGVFNPDNWGRRIKQETLEEAGDRELSYINDVCSKNIDFVSGFRLGMLLGAKWQKEKSYSEEEVEDLIYKVCGTVARLQGITLNGNHIDTAYEQFKKK